MITTKSISRLLLIALSVHCANGQDVTPALRLTPDDSHLEAANKVPIDHPRHRHPIFPMLLGAGAITWWLYESGEDSDEGRRNVGILWGGAALVAAGIGTIAYFNNRQGEVGAAMIDNQPGLFVSYRY